MARRQKFLIGISGLTQDKDGNRIGSMGAGKDTVANFLEANHAGVRLSFADPLKRICMEVYDFTVEQLWGSLEQKNAVDKRYPRPNHDIEIYNPVGNFEHLPTCRCCGVTLRKDEAQQCYLTPRYAMILLGTEWGRHCFQNTWVNYTLRAARKLLFESGIARSVFYNYSQQDGLFVTSVPEGPMIQVVAIPDVRFKSETSAIKEQGGKLVRVIRTLPEQARRTLHPSESELLAMEDSEFDYIIHNNGSLTTTEAVVAQMMDVFSGKISAYDEAQEDVPPFRR